MEFRVLGSLDVRRGDDVVIIGSSNERKLLTALLVDANAVVSTARLIEVLWGDDPPPSDRNTLQTYIARLRHRLSGGGAAAPIVSRPPGYVIELRPHELDSLWFRELVARGSAALSEDPGRALEILNEALALWRGPAFAEFADEEVARAEAVCLDELRETAGQERVEALLAVGRSAEAVSELERAVAAHPLRERPHAQLMRALSRCGRQVDALRLYQRYRERLADELGLEPTAGLRDLEGDILRQAPHVSPIVLPPSPSSAGTLAPPVTLFVGREGELAELVALVDRARVVTLVGVGGVGKTRLALRLAEEVAPRFADGACMVELAPITSPEAVPHAVAAALGVVQPPGRSLEDALADALRPRQMLLVVDNCEHVLDSASRLVEALARRCPSLTVVTTSRERLAVAGEHVWAVPPLPVPAAGARAVDDVEGSPAVALFVDRGRAARAGFRLDDANAAAVADICRGLDGVPLALEIAAARLGVLTAADLAGRLCERFSLLTAGPRGEGGRHRTLRGVVEWSYGLLDEAERAVFDRLSVFAGGWTLESATSVCAGDGVPACDVATLVVSLAERSMVVPTAPAGSSRYGMLETLRLYGAERLDARKQSEPVCLAHARHFVAVAEEAEVGLRGPGEREWVGRLRAELDNLRAAHLWCQEHGEADLALRLSAALHRFACWQVNDEVLSWAEAAAELPSAAGHPLLPVVLGSAAAHQAHRGDMAAAAERARRALSVCAGDDDPRRALPTEALGTMCLMSGRLDEAFDLHEEALRLWRLLGYDQGVVWSLCTRAVVEGKRGRLESALALTEEAREVAASTGNPTMMACVLYSQGECLLEVEPVRALAPIEEALELAASVDNAFMKGAALVSATSLLGRHGDARQALRLFEDVLEHWQRRGNWIQQRITLRNLVDLLARVGAHEPAAVLYGACAASSTATPAYGAEARRLQGVVATLVSSLGQQRVEEATARGATLSGDEAVSFASETIRCLPTDEQVRVDVV